jgi:hypothetical protein
LAQEANNIKIESLRSEITRLQGLLNKHKLELADAVLENKEAKQSISALEELKQQQFQSIVELTAENADLRSKIDEAIVHIEERDNKITIYEEELIKLKGSLIKSRDTMVESLSVAETSKKELKEATSHREKAEEQYEKAKDEFIILWAKNEEYLKRIEFLEFREKELTDTVDELFKERNHLQNTIDKLLTGVNKNISYSQEAKVAEDKLVLEPSKFLPYLPFCFPERLSSLIKFKREIRQTMRGTLKAAVTGQAPRAFSHNKKMNERLELLTGFSMNTELMGKKSFEFSVSKLVAPKRLKISEFSGLEPVQKPVNMGVAQDAGRRLLGARGQLLPLRQLNLISLPFQMPSLKKFGIIAYSHKSFMKYMDTTLIRDSSWHRQRIREENIMRAMSFKMFELAPKNIFIEQMLAFRHRLSIKSHMKMVRRSEMKYSFLKEHRLKSVLETFGKTLDSMVQRYGA